MNHIILIGFMGAGKSTVGRHLAREMKLPFVDSDDLIETQAHMKIADIFQKYGEPYFRDLETLTLRQLADAEERMVIAVGGGLPMRQENQEYLQNIGTVVYLKATVETLLKRLSGDTKRPLLQGESPETAIRKLMQEREPVYEAVAAVTIITDNKNQGQIAQEVERNV